MIRALLLPLSVPLYVVVALWTTPFFLLAEGFSQGLLRCYHQLWLAIVTGYPVTWSDVYHYESEEKVPEEKAKP
jgi:hypothetical protein